MTDSPARLLLTATPQHEQRTHTCGALRDDHVGQEVILKGWVDTPRDLGSLVFIDLRDRYGLTQLVFAEGASVDAYRMAAKLRGEDVVSVRGTVRERERPNPELPTGHVEVVVSDIEVLNTAEPLPFMVSAHEERQQHASEDLRLRYRYLDLRKPALQRNLLLRHRLYQATRRYFDTEGFVEIETPVLMKSTPEGARDYLVPSRVHAGKFFALPQSPQTYKQLLMVAGLDRYVQITKCFRDEDLRADRQPEFTQIDVEMTFATEEQVYKLVEGLIAAVWQETRGVEIETPFPRLAYAEAMRRYGSDKPDLRFGLELVDVSDALKGSGFRVFEQTLEKGGAVVALRVPGEGERGRNQMDKLTAWAKEKLGVPGLFYVKLPAKPAPAEAGASDFSASVKEEALPRPYVQAVLDMAEAEAGDLVLMLAGSRPAVFEAMGGLRVRMAEETGLIPESLPRTGSGGADGPWNFLWVTDFPLLDYSEEDGRYHAMHHPFTSPRTEDVALLDRDPGAVRARAYDLVLNGMELGGGSIRIHTADLQRRMFELLGIGDDEAQRRFGFLLDAFRYGAPPHGGIALGLDRMTMLLTGAASLRDVIAFPKTQAATEPMSGAPDAVDADQMDALHIRLADSVVQEPVETTRVAHDPT